MNLHYRPPHGWMNDPHGIVFHGGQYHLFHQSVPHSLTWEPGIEWAHATAENLTSFTYRGAAIAPGEGDDGIWTGCIIDNDGPQMYYTSVQQPTVGLSRIRLARPDDDSLDSWSKGNVVANAPRSVANDYRDPFVFRDGDLWRMLVGSDSVTGEAVAHGYTSVDGETWSYDQVALARHRDETEPVWMGSLWECPQVFEVDGSWVLLTSVWHEQQTLWAGYAVGGFRDGQFIARNWGRLSFGTLYAPTVFRDRHGRVSMMAWVREANGEGWAGCLTVPYLLQVDADRLVAVPHPDVASQGRKWLPEGELVIGPATLTAEPDVVRVVAAGREASLPNASGLQVSIFSDDAAIEVVGQQGILALPVT